MSSESYLLGKLITVAVTGVLMLCFVCSACCLTYLRTKDILTELRAIRAALEARP